MSDKETAPWIKKAAKEILDLRGASFGDPEEAITEIIAKHAEECTAQAPTQLYECRCIILAPRSSKYCADCGGLVEANQVAATPQGTPTTDPFSKGYKHREGKPVSDACGDGKHSECTQDLTKCHCTFRTGHTVLHAYMNPKLGQSAPAECPQCGSKDFWTVLPACHGGKAHKWHTKEK